MSTPVYDPPRGRNSYLGYVAACVIGIGLLVSRYVADLAQSIRTGTVTVPVHVDPTSAVPQPPGGATVRTDELSLLVRTADVPAGAIGYIRVGDALELVFVAALIGLVAIVAWRIAGAACSTPPRRRSSTCWPSRCSSPVRARVVRRMGWNWVVSGLGWEGRCPTPCSTRCTCRSTSGCCS